MPRFGLVLLLLAFIPAAQVRGQTRDRAEAWRTSWAAPPGPPMGEIAGAPAGAVTPAFNNQTIEQVVRLSASGRRLRLRLSNEYGSTPLVIGRVRVVALQGGKSRSGEAREVTFSGARIARIPPHAPILSDPIELPLNQLAVLKVSIYLPEATGPCTCHAVGLQKADISPPGDYTDRPFTPAFQAEGRAFLSAVEVAGAGGRLGVVAFGDSITDGYRSTTGANRRWPDRFAERLAQAHSDVAVANEGLSGNRVLSDGAIPIFGESALTRFDRDVLGLAGVTHVIVLEGVNDLGGKPEPSAEALIAGYRQMIARAHAHGIKISLATILPYKGAAYFRPDGEAVRTTVNTWIRTAREADDVVDFDAIVRDPHEPARMRADLQSGDWLHPNDAGYRAMGDAVPTALSR